MAALPPAADAEHHGTLIRGASTYRGPRGHLALAYLVDFGSLAFWVVLGLWLSSSIFADGRTEEGWALAAALLILFEGHILVTILGIRRRGLMKALLRRRLEVTTEGIVLPLLHRDHRLAYPDNFVPWEGLHRLVWVRADPQRSTSERLRVEIDVPRRYLHDQTRAQYLYDADEVGDLERVVTQARAFVAHKVKVQDVAHRQRLREALA